MRYTIESCTCGWVCYYAYQTSVAASESPNEVLTSFAGSHNQLLFHPVEKIEVDSFARDTEYVIHDTMHVAINVNYNEEGEHAPNTRHEVS